MDTTLSEAPFMLSNRPVLVPATPAGIFFYFILWAADALAALTRPGHIVGYAPGDLRACRLPATQIILQNLFHTSGWVTGNKKGDNMSPF
jgi:hypothetical protein